MLLIIENMMRPTPMKRPYMAMNSIASPEASNNNEDVK
jgi:hypothetical protein